jgi:hypothetical protein
MEREAEQLIGELLPNEWIIRRIEHDYGVDFEIELVDQESVTGNRIWVQSKAIQQAQRRIQEFLPDKAEAPFRVEYVPYSLETRELLYALRCAFPLLLFLSDLTAQDVFWVPLRDEIDTFLDRQRPTWRSQQTTTVRLPVRNSLRREAAEDYEGLRWYALEPARMNAFVRLHWAIHDFAYEGRLSGYAIGNGWIDDGAEPELRRSLELARRYMSDALVLDVLFSEHGWPIAREFTAKQLQQGIASAAQALALLDAGTYHWTEMASLTLKVFQGMELLSTTISSYQIFREHFVVSELAALFYGQQGGSSDP